MQMGILFVAVAVALAAAGFVWPPAGGGYNWRVLQVATLPAIMGPAFIGGSLYLQRFGPGSQLIVESELLPALRAASQRSPGRIVERPLDRKGDKIWRPLTEFVVPAAGATTAAPLLTLDLYEADGEKGERLKETAAKLKIAPPLLMVLIDHGPESEPAVDGVRGLAIVHLFGLDDDEGGYRP